MNNLGFGHVSASTEGGGDLVDNNQSKMTVMSHWEYVAKGHWVNVGNRPHEHGKTQTQVEV